MTNTPQSNADRARLLIRRAWRRKSEQRAFQDQRDARDAYDAHMAQVNAARYRWPAEQLGMTQLLEEQE